MLANALELYEYTASIGDVDEDFAGTAEVRG